MWRLLFVAGFAVGGRILVLPAPDGGSHMQSMSPYCIRLASVGHDVHIVDFANPYPKYNYTNVTMRNIFFPGEDHSAVHKYRVWRYFIYAADFMKVYWMQDAKFDQLLHFRADEIEQVVNERWDLVVVDDLFNPHGWALTLRLHERGVPYIIFSTSGQVCSTTTESMALSRSPVIKEYMFPSIPGDPDSYFKASNFWNRLNAFINVAHEVAGFDLVLQNSLHAITKFGIKDFSWTKLVGDSSLLFSDSVDRLGWSQSEGNDLVNIGFNCKKSEQLDDPALVEFMAGGDGVIFIAFGNFADWSVAPGHVLEAFKEAIRRLHNYRVVFGFNGNLSDMPQASHVKYMKWAPQPAILNHPRTKLFISHGGMKSLKEGICSNTPMIVMPLYAEQVHNAHMALALKWGGFLNKYTITADELYNEAKKVLTDPSYVDGARRNHEFLLDRPMPALDLAVYYTERTLRAKKGRVTFKRKGISLHWFQYLYLDILAVILGVTALAIASIRTVFSICIPTKTCD